jgi:hypothetical protein
VVRRSCTHLVAGGKRAATSVRQPRPPRGPWLSRLSRLRWLPEKPAVALAHEREQVAQHRGGRGPAARALAAEHGGAGGAPHHEGVALAPPAPPRIGGTAAPEPHVREDTAILRGVHRTAAGSSQRPVAA